MKILEWFLNVVIDISSMLDRTHDEYLFQQRIYQKRILVFTIMCLALLIMCIQIAPEIQLKPSDGFSYFSNNLQLQLAKICMWISAISGIATIYNLIGLIWYRCKFAAEDF